MARILISSTCHDLADLRNFLDLELRSYGFETVLSENGTLPVDSAKHSYENCLDAARECEITVGVIDGRFGGEYQGTGKSITQLEIETAIEAGRQVQVFARRNVLAAKEALKPYLTTPAAFRKSKVVEDRRVFDVVDSLTKRTSGNWIHGFDTPQEILFILSKQLGFDLRPGRADHGSDPYGRLDVGVWGASRHLRLGRDGVGPLRPGEFVRLFSSCFPAAYQYLIWLDSDGRATPIFPWRDFRWGTRQGNELPQSEVEVPTAKGEGWRLTAEPAGYETLILLARPTALKADEEESLRAALEGYPPQRPVSDPEAVSWFEGGIEVERKVRGLEPEAKPIVTPAYRLATLLGGTLSALAPVVRAVMVARTS